MRALVWLCALVWESLIGGTASAQEAKGWLGANVLDVTKAVADKLNWDAPHGAKVGVVASGSPAEKARMDSEVGMLRFSQDGQRLLSTGAYSSTAPQIVWDVGSGKRLLQPRHHDNMVIAAAISPDGGLAATGGGDRFPIRIWELTTGAVVKLPDGKSLALEGTGAATWSVGVSMDSQQIAWGNVPHPGGNQLSRLEYRLQLATANNSLGRPEPLNGDAADAFIRARASYGAVALSHRAGGAYGYDAFLDLKENDKLVASVERGATNGYQHRAYTFTPNGQTIISGGSTGSLTAYDLKGQRLGDFVGHEGDVWAVTASPDGRLLISGSNDETVRLWNIKTRELIATLFNGSDGEWVMWTPQGYDTGSPGADKIVGWQINRGPDQVADFVGADQLRDHLNRPDIVEKAIILASAEAAVREALNTLKAEMRKMMCWPAGELSAERMPGRRQIPPLTRLTYASRYPGQWDEQVSCGVDTSPTSPLHGRAPLALDWPTRRSGDGYEFDGVGLNWE